MRTRHRTRHPGISYRLVDESNPDGPRRFIVGYSDANGDWHTETLPLGATLSDAKERRAKLQTRRAQGETLIKTKKTVSELLDQWLESRKDSLKPVTVEAYEWGIAHIKEEIGRRKIIELSASDVFGLRSKLQRKGMKTWSIKKVETPLKSALQLAVREGYIFKNPYQDSLPHERLKNDQKEMRCLSKEEIALLLKTAKKSLHGHGSRWNAPRWHALFSTLVFAGLRISEALSLKWTDIDFDRNVILVRAGKTKSASREVILFPALRSCLRRYFLQQAPSIMVFPGTRREALRALRAAEKRAGLPNYTLHELRHTFASILIAQGELPTLVASQMGHADPGVTMKTYAHLFEKEESLTRASQRLQASFGGLV